MKWEPLGLYYYKGDISREFKESTRVEQYRVSGKLIFLPREKYIPLVTIKRIELRRGLMSGGHCCGMGFPVYNVIIFHGTDRPERLVFENARNAERLAGLITGAVPDIPMEDLSSEGDRITYGR